MYFEDVIKSEEGTSLDEEGNVDVAAASYLSQATSLSFPLMSESRVADLYPFSNLPGGRVEDATHILEVSSRFSYAHKRNPAQSL